MLRASSRKAFPPRPYVIRRRMLRQFPHFSERLRENYYKRFSSNGESRPYLVQNVHFLKRTQCIDLESASERRKYAAGCGATGKNQR